MEGASGSGSRRRWRVAGGVGPGPAAEPSQGGKATGTTGGVCGVPIGSVEADNADTGRGAAKSGHSFSVMEWVARAATASTVLFPRAGDASNG